VVSNFVREIIITLLIAVALYLGINTTLQNSEVIGQSMEPNLHDMERVLISKLSYKFGNTPQRGDVVVFTPPSSLSSENDYIKRIIGLPGEIVEVKNGEVFIHQPGGSSFEMDEGSYIVDPARYNYKSDIIPPGEYLVFGDNRNNSNDSHGGWTVPLKDIVGKAWLVIWPPDEWGVAPNKNASELAIAP
jgi:signal peptidase I